MNYIPVAQMVMAQWLENETNIVSIGAKIKSPRKRRKELTNLEEPGFAGATLISD